MSARRCVFVLLWALVTLSQFGCSLLKEKKPSDEDTELTQLVKKPLPPGETEGLLKEAGSNFVYGQGLGEAALNVGTVVAFPPYAAYLLGNAALELGGYEPVHITDALPEEQKEEYDYAYSNVTSSPGRVVAAASGEEFRTNEVARENLKSYLKNVQAKTPERSQRRIQVEQ